MTYLHRVRIMFLLYRKRIGIIGVCLLVALMCFVWGYTLGTQGVRTPIIIEMKGQHMVQ